MLEKGFDAERVNYDEPRFPFDVLINGCVKVDVKVARVFGSDKQGYYSLWLSLFSKTYTIFRTFIWLT